MILSASRRTDIPAFYGRWFLNRIEEGYLLVRNPMNPHRISLVSLDPAVVDCIVFWTKNPAPFFGALDSLTRYHYYFQFTLTPYGRDVEPGLPPKETVVESFIALSRKIGADRVLWRYDPILFGNGIDIDYHLKAFESLAERLEGHTRKCIISFMNSYNHTRKNIESGRIRCLPEDEMTEIARAFAAIALDKGLILESCAEERDFSPLGISRGKCIDDRLVSKIIGREIEAEKDPVQRKHCGCVASIDIGTYNTCPHSCLYCYADFSKKSIEKNRADHNPSSPLLTGTISPNDIITERKMPPCKPAQGLLFP